LAILAPGQTIWKYLNLLLIAKTDLGSSHLINCKRCRATEEPGLDLPKLHFKISICKKMKKLGYHRFCPSTSYCGDRKGTGYDFETDPESEHDVEIITLRSTARMQIGVS
jgi:hypothetical protein